MRRTILTGLLLLLSTGVAAAQTQTQGDACHVYVVDLEKAERVVKGFLEKRDPRAVPPSGADAGETVFPEFYTKVGEEELTTKGYPFPGSKLFITASVFYTDESMRSSNTADSMLVGVLVSDKLQKEALWGENTAVAEVTYGNNADVVRAKQRLKVGGRLYVVGIECRSKTGAASR